MIRTLWWAWCNSILRYLMWLLHTPMDMFYGLMIKTTKNITTKLTSLIICYVIKIFSSLWGLFWLNIVETDKHAHLHLGFLAHLMIIILVIQFFYLIFLSSQICSSVWYFFQCRLHMVFLDIVQIGETDKQSHFHWACGQTRSTGRNSQTGFLLCTESSNIWNKVSAAFTFFGALGQTRSTTPRPDFYSLGWRFVKSGTYYSCSRGWAEHET